jgi:DNA mismatch repair protein MutS2
VNERTLRVLEFPKVLERLAAHTSFSAGRELALALQPSLDITEVEVRLDTTTEARTLLERQSELTLGGAHDIRESVRLAGMGFALDPELFLQIATTLTSSRTLRRAIIKQGQAGGLFYLGEIARRLVELPLLENTIEQTIGPDGTVLDSASSNLRRIRSDIRIAHGRLLEKLNSILGSSQYQPAIQESIITMREGRYVIPVKNDFKGQLRGIVHDQSASGATVFLEPLIVVDLNNNWKQLQLQEKEEIERILRELAKEVARHGNEIVVAVEGLAELDLAFAKARYAATLRAEAPKLGLPDDPDPTKRLLNFVQARHPLLTGKVVPIDLYLGADFRVLVITGPNTGGKTVAIKTAGLLTLMAQAGLHLPVESGSQALVFQKIFADIGDEQSIEQSLSTFSSHLTNIIRILDQLDEQTLVIFDELGAGTDPAEGSALARAIINFLLDKKSDAILTTHYSELKTFAYITPGVQNASVEFDVESLSPTYHLDIGLPGRSNALAIARRLGLRDDIISGAQNLLAPEETQVDALLAEIYKERELTANVRLQTIKLQAETERLRDQLKQELRTTDEARREAVREARQEARQALENEMISLRDESRLLRQRLLDIEQVARQSAETAEVAVGLERQRRALAEAERAAEALQREARRRSQQRQVNLTALTDLAAEPEDTTPLKAGDRVMIESLNQEGTILSTPDNDGRCEVSFGSFKLKLNIADLHRLKGKGRGQGAPTQRDQVDYQNAREKESAIRINARTRTEAPPDTSIELDMRGWRAEVVADELDRYLNDAYLANLPFVRLIHGKGTGVLRQVVRDYLRRSPLITDFRSGEQGEGGDGVTVAKIKS